jgi:predicted DCC family thiol-disulfide oxidoreductase YuxK
MPGVTRAAPTAIAVIFYTMLPAESAPPPPADRAADAAVLLYDGGCGVCAHSVQFVLAHEPVERRAALRFAPLEGAFASGVRAAHPELAAVDSVVWVEPASTGGRVLVRSDAALAALTHLGGVWAAASAIGRVVPRPIRDAVYRLVARNRFRLRPAACLLPTPAERERFLA